MKKQYDAIYQLMADIICVSLRLYHAHLLQVGGVSEMGLVDNLKRLIEEIDTCLQSETATELPSLTGVVYSRRLERERMLNRPFVSGGITADRLKKVLGMLKEAAPDVITESMWKSLSSLVKGELSAFRRFSPPSEGTRVAKIAHHHDKPYEICEKAKTITWTPNAWTHIQDFVEFSATIRNDTHNNNSLFVAFLLFSVTLEWLARNTKVCPTACEPHSVLTWLLGINQVEIKPEAAYSLAQEDGMLTVACMLAIFKVSDPANEGVRSAVQKATGPHGTGAKFIKEQAYTRGILPAYIRQSFHLSSKLQLRCIPGAVDYNLLTLPMQFIMPGVYRGKEAVPPHVLVCPKDPKTLHLLLSPTGYGKSAFVKAAVATGMYAWMQPWQRDGIKNASWYVEHRMRIWNTNDQAELPMLLTGLPYGRLTALDESERDLFDDAINQYTAACGEEKVLCSPTDEEACLLKAELVKLAEEGRLIAIIDAFDEALKREILVQRIQAFRQQYPKCKVLVTGRPLSPGDYADLQEDSYEEFAINFTEQDLNALIDLWHAAAIPGASEEAKGKAEADKKALRESRFLGEMSTPYLATMMLYFRNSKRIYSVGQMYKSLSKDIVEKMYSRAPGSNKLPKVLKRIPADVLLARLFEPLAWACVKEDRSTVSMSEIRTQLQKNAENILPDVIGAMEQETFKRWWLDTHQLILTQPGLLVAADNQLFYWLTTGLMQHLAAKYLLRLIPSKVKAEEISRFLCYLEEVNNDRLFDLTVALCYQIAFKDKQDDNTSAQARNDRFELIPPVVQNMIRYTFSDRDRFEERCALYLACCDALLKKELYGATDLTDGAKRWEIESQRQYLKTIWNGLTRQGVDLPKENE